MRFTRLVVFGLCLCWLRSASAQERVEFNAISKVEVKPGLVEIVGTSKPSFTTFTLSDPVRLVIDISEAVFSGVPAEIRVTDPLISGIKTASYGSEGAAIARVLVGFKRQVEPEVSVSGYRLVIRFNSPVPVDKVSAEQQRLAEEEAARVQRDQLLADRAAKAAEKAEAARVERERQAAEAEARKAARAAEREAARKNLEQEREQRREAARLLRLREKEEAAAKAEADKAEKVRRAEEAAAKAATAKAEKARRAEEAAAERARRAEEAAAKAATAKAEKARRAEEAAAERARRAEEAAAKAKAAREAKDRRAAEASAEKARRKEEAEALEAARRAEKARLVDEVEAQVAAQRAERLGRETAQVDATTDAGAMSEKPRELEAARLTARDGGTAVVSSTDPSKAPDGGTAPPPASSIVEAPPTSTPPAPAGAEVSARRKTLTVVGFRPSTDRARVFIRTDEVARYRVSDSGNRVVLELENTQLGAANNSRPIDTSFFGSPVMLIRSTRGAGNSVRVEIQLQGRVPYEVRQDGPELVVAFPPKR